MESDSADDAVESARQLFRFGITGWKVQAELPIPVNFDSATSLVTADHMRNQFGCGPDVELEFRCRPVWRTDSVQP